MVTLITGSDGLLGNAIKSVYQDDGFVFIRKQDCDLTDRGEVERLYRQYRPKFVIHTAAKVGGVKANLESPGELFYDNILMNSHMIHYASKFNVQKFICFSALCVFGDQYTGELNLKHKSDCGLLVENSIHNQPPFDGHFAYAYAKRMADIQISAYQKQYKIKNFCSVIPGSMFGEHDNFHLEHGHVVPSLIHKIYLAKQSNQPLSVWGDGSAVREFIYAKDVAKIVLQLLELDQLPQRVIVSSPFPTSIESVVRTLCRVSGFDNEVIWQSDKPNGQNARKSSTKLLNSLINPTYTPLDQSLLYSYRWFEDNWPNMRK